MQREDVERRKVDTSREAVERIAAFCEQFSLNIPATLRALLDRAERAEDERDAAFAAGQEEMLKRVFDLLSEVKGIE